MSVSLTPEMQKDIDTRLTEIEKRIDVIERLLSQNQSSHREVETIRKPFWAEGGWMCNICLEFLHENYTPHCTCFNLSYHVGDGSNKNKKTMPNETTDEKGTTS